MATPLFPLDNQDFNFAFLYNKSAGAHTLNGKVNFYFLKN